jgi:hypothetical protein
LGWGYLVGRQGKKNGVNGHVNTPSKAARKKYVFSFY